MTHNIQADGVPELTLGWRIQMALAAAGLKQTDLMEHFELSRGTISRWCRDEGVPPRRYQIQQIALMTGVNAGWLETGIAPTETGPDGGECPQSVSIRRPADYKGDVLAFPVRQRGRESDYAGREVAA